MLESRETINYKYYLSDKAYKDSANLVRYWNQMQDFYEGKQFPDGYLIGIPKFTANLCKYLINTKASKLRGTPYTLAFQSSNKTATTKLERFDKFILLDLKYDTELQDSIINMLIYGTEIVFYHFDDNSVSLDALYKGKLSRDHIDLRRFAVANPYLPSLQKQKWVMYWNYEEVEAVRERCRRFEGESEEDFKLRVDSILPDDYTEEKYPDTSYVSHGLCTVFTRYFRVNGEVCFQSSTKNVDLFDPISLNPHTNAKKLARKLRKSLEESIKTNRALNKVEDYKIDNENLMIEASKDNMSESEYIDELSKFRAYPFVDFAPTRRFNHFYGISDIQDVIAGQQVVNFCLTMAGKSIQENAWGKWIAKQGALRGQQINNDGGQLLIDYSKGNSFGVQRVEANSGNMLNIVEYVNQMLTILRTLSGANETITGENASQLSGYAISLLQEQGNTVFEMIQSKLRNDFAVSEATIRLQFYLFYYEDKIKFLYEFSDTEYENAISVVNERKAFDLEAYKANPNGLTPPNFDSYPTPEREVEEEFSSEDIKKITFYIVPKAGRGIKYSEVVQADQINQLFKDGTIANLSVTDKRAYIELNPMIDETTKVKFKAILDNQERSENARLVQANKQLQTAVEQQQARIESLTRQIQMYAQYVSDLKQEFKTRLSAADKVNQYKQNAIDEIIRQQDLNRKQENASSSPSQSEETRDIMAEGLNAAING